MESVSSIRILGSATPALLALLVLSACNGSDPLPPKTPPTEATHHAVITGRVVGWDGAPVDSVGVGARFAASSPEDLQVSVTGGAEAEPDGSYSFELRSRPPKRADGRIAAHVLARRYHPAGVLEDSVLVTVQVTELDEPAPVFAVPTTLTLPAPGGSQ